jgi:RNA polymerase sigma-70 factor (ECF subfamily)
MHDAARLAGLLVDLDGDALAREFEARLADSSALAFRVAYSVLRHRQDAEDVAQEAFARAFRRFTSLRDRDRFRAWLVRITWRLALDSRRGGRRRSAREEAAARDPVQAPDAETDVLARERSTRLWAAIDALPDKLRVAIVLSAIEGHGVRDVAALLAIPEGTVKSRLFEARKRLQELLR